MKDSLTIEGFGVITEKQAMFEVGYYANLMQDAYKSGHFNMAMSAMRAMRPFVDALLNRGYTIKQILPN